MNELYQAWIASPSLYARMVVASPLILAAAAFLYLLISKRR